jgi:hypothetical protein
MSPLRALLLLNLAACEARHDFVGTNWFAHFDSERTLIGAQRRRRLKNTDIVVFS